MVVIRLSRRGNRGRPAYRIVAADKTKPRDGRHLEVLGTHIPTGTQRGTTLHTERIQYWLSKGAQPSETVRALLKKQGVQLPN
ncbi:MAG: 30S ribosomal protein S16 [Deltaproteobacteria bacterium]|nr:30S ribosomal protein S16 [Deltaproteobacteria bacterium]